MYLQSRLATDYFTYIQNSSEPLDESAPNPTAITHMDKKCGTLQLL